MSIGTFTLVFHSDHFWSEFLTYCTLVPNTDKWQHHPDSFWGGTKPRDVLQDHTEGVQSRKGGSRADLPILSRSSGHSGICRTGPFPARAVTAAGRWSERSPNCSFSARSSTNRLYRISKQLPKQLRNYQPRGKGCGGEVGSKESCQRK